MRRGYLEERVCQGTVAHYTGPSTKRGCYVRTGRNKGRNIEPNCFLYLAIHSNATEAIVHCALPIDTHRRIHALLPYDRGEEERT